MPPAASAPLRTYDDDLNDLIAGHRMAELGTLYGINPHDLKRLRAQSGTPRGRDVVLQTLKDALKKKVEVLGEAPVFRRTDICPIGI